jgi:glycosyltransferase involved in cell wall biosynthesis
MALTIHMMTAALAQGDAIGNYVVSLVNALRQWGCVVYLYTDHTNPRYPLPHQQSRAYQPTGADILWMHYSIYSENVHWIQHSPDFVILDSHNVSPASLFAGYDPQMEWLCQEGERLLDLLPPYVQLSIAHTDYVRTDLLSRGYRTLYKLPLVVDTNRFTGTRSPQWEPLLPHLEYLLFVGRITPQKNLKVALRLFAALNRRRPQVQFFLIGGHYVPGYLDELRALAEELGIARAVVFTGLISEPEVLTSFYCHARFLVMLSTWESFCVPVIEALHFGTPILSHAVPPLPETMGPGGVLLHGDPEAMAEQVDALWDDTAQYQQMQQRGALHARHFTDQQLRADLLHLFGKLARGGI